MLSTLDLVILALSLQYLIGLCGLFGLIRNPATGHLNNVTSVLWPFSKCLQKSFKLVL